MSGKGFHAFVLCGLSIAALSLSSCSNGSEPPASADRPQFTYVAEQGLTHMVVVPPEKAGDDEYLLRVARAVSQDARASGRQASVEVLVWTDRELAPRHLPMSSAQLSAQVATVRFNPSTRTERVERRSLR